MDNILLFVYGTLRKDCSNYKRFLYNKNGVTFISSGATINRFALYSSGIPFLHKLPELSSIFGDIFQITNPLVMKNIDALEGHRVGLKNGYHREVTPIILNNENTVLAWCYFYYGEKHGELIKSGDWLNR